MTVQLIIFISTLVFVMIVMAQREVRMLKKLDAIEDRLDRIAGELGIEDDRAIAYLKDLHQMA